MAKPKYAIDPKKHPFLFSVGTRCAYNIDNDFYKGKHFMWLALSFDDLDHQAESSNPLTKAENFIKEVVSEDGDCDSIYQNIAGIVKGVKAKHSANDITDEERNTIFNRLADITTADFLPYLYIVDTRKVASRIIEVPPDQAARRTMSEYKIFDLVEGEFELVDLGAAVNAAKRVRRRRLIENGKNKFDIKKICAK